MCMVICFGDIDRYINGRHSTDSLPTKNAVWSSLPSKPRWGLTSPAPGQPDRVTRNSESFRLLGVLWHISAEMAFNCLRNHEINDPYVFGGGDKNNGIVCLMLRGFSLHSALFGLVMWWPPAFWELPLWVEQSKLRKLVVTMGVFVCWTEFKITFPDAQCMAYLPTVG